MRIVEMKKQKQTKPKSHQRKKKRWGKKRGKRRTKSKREKKDLDKNRLMILQCHEFFTHLLSR
jgi:hypothetical protein